MIVIELLLIVAGILAALSIDDWVKDRENLRDQLLRYFVGVSRTQLVIEKNNTVFIDDMY